MTRRVLDDHGAAVKLCECGCGEPAPIAKTDHSVRGHVAGRPVRFVLGHAARRPIMSKVEQGPGCWTWLGKHFTNGYGVYFITREKTQGAHRAVYEHLVGPIPDGLVLDHLCLNRGCVNPEHLEPVTIGENNRRMWEVRLGPPEHGTERMYRSAGCRCVPCRGFRTRKTA